MIVNALFQELRWCYTHKDINLLIFCNIFSYARFSFELIAVFICFGITSGFRGTRIPVCKDHLLLSGGFCFFLI